jgi:methylenetetrahydrofolate dehydrogenase (NADP+)/methenyltetrahydrofolate cyclohydrolase
LKERISSLKSKGVNPHLVVIIVGEDPASKIYVGAKERACERLGIVSTRHSLTANASEIELRDLLSKLNADDAVHGILVQSPLPDDLDELGLTDMIDPNKDVDGFHPVNLGRLVQGRMDGHLPCTPAGVMRMLEWANVDLNGKRAVVIGRSRIVGMPLSFMLAAKGSNATVSIVHSRTENIEAHCQQADVLIAAVGVAGLVKNNWVKNGAVVIDVGVNRVDDSSQERGWSLAGDVAPDVSEVASILSPVPGGVGPMTIAMLMSNTVNAAEKLSR